MTRRSGSQRQTSLIGFWGVSWVVTELSRNRNYAAATFENCPDVDVLALRPDTFEFRGIQVKTTGNKPMRFWQLGAKKPRKHTDLFFAFVRLCQDLPKNKNELETFVVPSAIVSKLAKQQGKKMWAIYPDQIAKFKNKWDGLWKP